jgi:hypothetical protein
MRYTSIINKGKIEMFNNNLLTHSMDSVRFKNILVLHIQYNNYNLHVEPSIFSQLATFFPLFQISIEQLHPMKDADITVMR